MSEVKEQTEKLEKAEQEIRNYISRIHSLEKQVREERERAEAVSDAASRREDEILSVTDAYRHSGTYKAAYMLHRSNKQLFHGSKDEKKEYMHWLGSKLLRRPSGERGNERAYNPFCEIEDIMARNPLRKELLAANRDKDRFQAEEYQRLLLMDHYTKADVIILRVIDYDFRFQRPQHFARRFAESGHRTFYVDANFHREVKDERIEENLYEIRLQAKGADNIYSSDFTDCREEMKELFDMFLFRYCIRDAVVIVDYPNWLPAAQYLKDAYGFFCVTDYMDDFTGFLDTRDDRLVRNCKELLRNSDHIIASSQFLSEIAASYNPSLSIVRNGTEFRHFAAACGMRKDNPRPVIGYYGAVAHWFDAEKVCCAARTFPDCEVRIIGAVTEWQEMLSAEPNINLLGEMPYQKLPEQLAQFDVCLIPFETESDLIKATNPVKFYEYLSAGKKVVATEIPELMPYRGRYVYMSNDNAQFCEYIRLCLSGEDTLAEPGDAIDFACGNDWQNRFEDFRKAVLSCAPKVSIIIVTYNNISYNIACLRSILHQTAYPDYEVILVDNASMDGTQDWLTGLEMKKIPNLRIIRNKENRGFAAANNQGIRAASGKYVVLLNNDTLVTRGWLSGMVKNLEKDPLIGMTGAVTNSIGNEGMIPAQYTDVQELRVFALRNSALHAGERYFGADMLAMFCTMIRKDLIDAYGGLDEAYGLGMYEDDDFAEALHSKEYDFCIADDVFIHHFHSLSFGKLASEKMEALYRKNREYFEKKWNTVWKPKPLRAGVQADTNREVRIDVMSELSKNLI